MVLPHAIKEAAENGDLDQVKAWLAAAPADQPRDVNDPAVGGERLLALVAFGVSGINDMTGTLLAATAAHVELLRDLIARGADPSLNLRIDSQDPRNVTNRVEITQHEGAAKFDFSHRKWESWNTLWTTHTG